MRRLAVVLAAATVAGCGDLMPPDLTREAVSPDGKLVARSWCRDSCDVPDARTITVSKAGTPVDPEAMLPSADIVADVYFAVDQYPHRVELNWTGDRALTIAAPCLTDRKYRILPRRRVSGIDLRFVRMQAFQRCWREQGQKAEAQ